MRVVKQYNVTKSISTALVLPVSMGFFSEKS